METRNEKFRRLSEARMTKVFSILNILRNQSDKSKYTFSKSDIEELFGALEQKGEEIKEFFTSPITIKTVNLKKSFHYSMVVYEVLLLFNSSRAFCKAASEMSEPESICAISATLSSAVSSLS